MSTRIHDAEVQFLTIAVAKDVGLDQKGLVAEFDSLFATRSEQRLQPILIYSVVAPGFSRYVRMLVDGRRPIPISEFLVYAWSAEAALGLPMSVQAKASLLEHDRGFVKWIGSLGIAVETAASINCINAFERASQKLQGPIHRSSRGSRAKSVALDAANASLLDHDAFSAFVGGARKSMYQYNYNRWNEREKRYCAEAPISNDWSPAAIVEHPKATLDPELAIPRHERRTLVPGINDVLSMWPNGRAAILKDLGIPPQEFDPWIHGQCRLRPEHFSSIDALLDLEYMDARYVEEEIWRMGGGYLLLASLRARTASAYDVLSHGGDLEFAFEIVGPSSERPSSRVLIFAPVSGNATIMLFGRGTPAEKLLDEEGPLDLQEPICAPPKIWKDVQYIVEHQLEFETPELVGAEFGSAHSEWLATHTQRICYGA